MPKVNQPDQARKCPTREELAHALNVIAAALLASNDAPQFAAA